MLKRLKWTIVLAVLLMPATAIAAVSAEMLIQAHVGVPVLDVTTSPEEGLAFLLTPKAVLIYSVDEKKTVDQIPLEGAYDRIAFLDNERLVLTRAKSSQIDVIRFNRIYAIDLKDRITQGPADAPVTLVVFDDYQCPYCARLDRYIKEQILPQFPNEVRYAIKHFPLSSHPFAYEGAMAALAAGKQGKFWEFHSRLLANHNQVNDAKILEIASELKLDMQRFNKDRTSEALRKIISEDIDNGHAIGVTGTPSIFINGKRFKKGDLIETIVREIGR